MKLSENLPDFIEYNNFTVERYGLKSNSIYKLSKESRKPKI